MKKLIKLKLNDSEIQTLRIISGKYESPRLLLDAYDEDTGKWDLYILEKAYKATKYDGGDLGTVPLIGKELKNKIKKLFKKI
jgi:hypothetical protein